MQFVGTPTQLPVSTIRHANPIQPPNVASERFRRRFSELFPTQQGVTRDPFRITQRGVVHNTYDAQLAEAQRVQQFQGTNVALASTRLNAQQSQLNSRDTPEDQQARNVEQSQQSRRSREIRSSINIDSRHRNRALYPFANQYKITLPRPFVNVKRVHLLSSEFSQRESTIRVKGTDANHKFVWRNVGIDDNILFTAQLDGGVYTDQTLAGEFTSNLNKVAHQSGLLHNFASDVNSGEGVFFLSQSLVCPSNLCELSCAISSNQVNGFPGEHSVVAAPGRLFLSTMLPCPFREKTLVQVTLSGVRSQFPKDDFFMNNKPLPAYSLSPYLYEIVVSEQLLDSQRAFLNTLDSGRYWDKATLNASFTVPFVIETMDFGPYDILALKGNLFRLPPANVVLSNRLPSSIIKNIVPNSGTVVSLRSTDVPPDTFYPSYTRFPDEVHIQTQETHRFEAGQKVTLWSPDLGTTDIDYLFGRVKEDIAPRVYFKATREKVDYFGFVDVHPLTRQMTDYMLLPAMFRAGPDAIPEFYFDVRYLVGSNRCEVSYRSGLQNYIQRGYVTESIDQFEFLVLNDAKTQFHRAEIRFVQQRFQLTIFDNGAPIMMRYIPALLNGNGYDLDWDAFLSQPISLFVYHKAFNQVGDRLTRDFLISIRSRDYPITFLDANMNESTQARRVAIRDFWEVIQVDQTSSLQPVKQRIESIKDGLSIQTRRTTYKLDSLNQALLIPSNIISHETISNEITWNERAKWYISIPGAYSVTDRIKSDGTSRSLTYTKNALSNNITQFVLLEGNTIIELAPVTRNVNIVTIREPSQDEKVEGPLLQRCKTSSRPSNAYTVERKEWMPQNVILETTSMPNQPKSPVKQHYVHTMADGVLHCILDYTANQITRATLKRIFLSNPYGSYRWNKMEKTTYSVQQATVQQYDYTILQSGAAQAQDTLFQIVRSYDDTVLGAPYRWTQVQTTGDTPYTEERFFDSTGQLKQIRHLITADPVVTLSTMDVTVLNGNDDNDDNDDNSGNDGNQVAVTSFQQSMFDSGKETKIRFVKKIRALQISFLSNGILQKRHRRYDIKYPTYVLRTDIVDTGTGVQFNNLYIDETKLVDNQIVSLKQSKTFVNEISVKDIEYDPGLADTNIVKSVCVTTMTLVNGSVTQSSKVCYAKRIEELEEKLVQVQGQQQNTLQVKRFRLIVEGDNTRVTEVIHGDTVEESLYPEIIDKPPYQPTTVPIQRVAREKTPEGYDKLTTIVYNPLKITERITNLGVFVRESTYESTILAQRETITKDSQAIQVRFTVVVFADIVANAASQKRTIITYYDSNNVQQRTLLRTKVIIANVSTNEMVRVIDTTGDDEVTTEYNNTEITSASIIEFSSSIQSEYTIVNNQVIKDGIMIVPTGTTLAVRTYYLSTWVGLLYTQRLVVDNGKLVWQENNQQLSGSFHHDNENVEISHPEMLYKTRVTENAFYTHYRVTDGTIAFTRVKLVFNQECKQQTTVIQVVGNQLQEVVSHVSVPNVTQTLRWVSVNAASLYKTEITEELKQNQMVETVRKVTLAPAHVSSITDTFSITESGSVDNDAFYIVSGVLMKRRITTASASLTAQTEFVEIDIKTLVREETLVDRTVMGPLATTSLVSTAVLDGDIEHHREQLVMVDSILNIKKEFVVCINNQLVLRESFRIKELENQSIPVTQKVTNSAVSITRVVQESQTFELVNETSQAPYYIQSYVEGPRRVDVPYFGQIIHEFGKYTEGRSWFYSRQQLSVGIGQLVTDFRRIASVSVSLTNESTVETITRPEIIKPISSLVPPQMESHDLLYGEVIYMREYFKPVTGLGEITQAFRYFTLMFVYQNMIVIQDSFVPVNVGLLRPATMETFDLTLQQPTQQQGQQRALIDMTVPYQYYLLNPSTQQCIPVQFSSQYIQFVMDMSPYQLYLAKPIINGVSVLPTWGYYTVNPQGNIVALSEQDQPVLTFQGQQYDIVRTSRQEFYQARYNDPPIASLTADWTYNPLNDIKSNGQRLYSYMNLIRVNPDQTLTYLQFNTMTNTLHAMERVSLLPFTRNRGYDCRVLDNRNVTIPYPLPDDVFFIGMHRMVQSAPEALPLRIDSIEQVGSIDVNPGTYVLLTNPLLETIYDTGPVRNIMAKILMTSSESSKPVFSTFIMPPKIFHDQYPTITDLSFEIYRSNGTLADPFDHSFTLDITEHIDTIATAGYDTRRGVITDTSFKFTY